MWKAIRTFLAISCLVGFALLFLDQSENSALAQDLAWLARLQLVSAMLAGSVLVVLALAVLTLLLGRVYCSVLCPLGLLQDVLASRRGGRRYEYRPARPVLRFVMLAIFVAALALGVPVIYGLLEPYSAFGRIATDLGGPLAVLVNNGLEWLTRGSGSMAFMPQPLFGKGTAAMLTAVATLFVLLVLTRLNGRIWCNTLCPVGTFLGLLSRHALVRPRMDATKCTHCGRCANRCKASCLDADTATVDASRCVACFNCKDVCTFGALTFGREDKAAAPAPRNANRRTSGNAQSRRTLLASLLAGAGTLVAPELAYADGDESGKPAVQYRDRRPHDVPVLPPGAQGAGHFAARCTGCQLCVAACPNHVLQSRDNGMGLLQPAMQFEHGFCRVNCTVCGEVCPAGAILPVSREEKTAIQVGRASVNPELCVVTTDKVPCTACQRACPAGVISLVGEGELKRPAVDAEKCTGCGACEFHCPARPVAAITVAGNVAHRQI